MTFNCNFMEELFSKIILTVNNLDTLEITILVAITLILVAFLVYHLFGIAAAVFLFVLCLIGYVLYINDFFHVYEKRETEKAEYNKTIEEELNK